MARALLFPENSSGSGLNKDLLQEEFLWSCTTCGHCLDVCPAFIRPPEQVIDIRRSQVLMTGDVPQTVGETLRNFERQGNPWGMPAQNRGAWMEGLDIPVLSPGDEVDVLYYVGCAGAFDDRNQKVTRAFIDILNKLKVDYGVLGAAEMCCGETARRMGNEYLFQVAAEENIALLSEYKFNKIVTLCPHGLRHLKTNIPGSAGITRSFMLLNSWLGLSMKRHSKKPLVKISAVYPSMIPVIWDVITMSMRNPGSCSKELTWYP